MAEPYVTIEVDWPTDKAGRVRATGKGRPKFSNAGGFVRVYTPAKTRKFENVIKAAAKAAMTARSLKPLNEAIGLQVLAYMPIPASWSMKAKVMALAGEIMPTTKPDFENIAKLIDGINRDELKLPIVWGDDAHIVSAHVFKSYSDRPRLELRIYRWFDV
jgi:Holliday junction resolvase RusA-like endonuclease